MFLNAPQLEMEGGLGPSGWVGVVRWVVILLPLPRRRDCRSPPNALRSLGGCRLPAARRPPHIVSLFFGKQTQKRKLFAGGDDDVADVHRPREPEEAMERMGGYSQPG